MKRIKTKFFITKCLEGMNFVAIGLWNYSQENNWNFWLLDVILGITILGFFIFRYVITPKWKYEPVDEMTREHELRAQAIVYNGVCFLVALIGVICIVSDGMRNFMSVNLNWTYLFVLLGVLQICEYIAFMMIERNGDSIE